MEWISVKDEKPPINEPIVYAKPNPRKENNWHVGISYWSVSEKWEPEAQSELKKEGFTHWMPLPSPPVDK